MSGSGPQSGRCSGASTRRSERRLAAYGTGPDRFGLVHADTRLANLLVDEGSVSVIDFDDCGFSWYFYDLGTTVSFFEHRPAGARAHARAGCAATAGSGRSRAEDEAEIWTFILFRRLLLVAWIGSHNAVEIARELGSGYTRDSCELAEGYLSRFG